MATRAHLILINATIRPFKIPATKAVTEGFRVKFSGADDQVENCGAGEDGFAIALKSGVAGDSVECVLEGFAVAKVKVGTGGATRGLFAKMAADGFTDQAIVDGTNVRNLSGKFLQTGVAGDMVGLLLGAMSPTATT